MIGVPLSEYQYYEFQAVDRPLSKADQEAFMGSRLGAALAEVGVPAPSQIIESDLVNYQTP